MTFAQHVASFIGYTGSVDTFDWQKNRPQVNRLADQFAVAPLTVVRWAAGIATPHSALQQDILTFIAEQGRP